MCSPNFRLQLSRSLGFWDLQRRTGRARSSGLQGPQKVQRSSWELAQSLALTQPHSLGWRISFSVFETLRHSRSASSVPPSAMGSYAVSLVASCLVVSQRSTAWATFWAASPGGMLRGCLASQCLSVCSMKVSAETLLDYVLLDRPRTVSHYFERRFPLTTSRSTVVAPLFPDSECASPAFVDTHRSCPRPLCLRVRICSRWTSVSFVWHRAHHRYRIAGTHSRTGTCPRQ